MPFLMKGYQAISTSVLKYQSFTGMQIHATLVRIVKAEAKSMETLPSLKAQHASFTLFYCMQEVNCFTKLPLFQYYQCSRTI